MRFLTYRVVPLAEGWPAAMPKTLLANRVRGPFKLTPNRAVGMLLDEIERVAGRDVTVALDVEARHIRTDGMLYANARPSSPAVAVSFTKGRERLVFPCDTFSYYESNIRAIAGVLDALRRIDRYGVKHGAQYVGYRAIGSGQSAGNGTAPAMSLGDAAILLVRTAYPHFTDRVHTDITHTVIQSRSAFDDLAKVASKRAHPDAGGSTEAFQRVQAAIATLKMHHQAEEGHHA